MNRRVMIEEVNATPEGVKCAVVKETEENPSAVLGDKGLVTTIDEMGMCHFVTNEEDRGEYWVHYSQLGFMAK